jgi:hypothetical protein
MVVGLQVAHEVQPEELTKIPSSALPFVPGHPLYMGIAFGRFEFDEAVRGAALDREHVETRPAAADALLLEIPEHALNRRTRPFGLADRFGAMDVDHQR